MSLLYRLFSVLGLVLIAVVFTACSRHKNSVVLLFNGTGTSTNDVAAVEAILDNSDIGYSKANSSELNAMRPSELAKYRLLIIPGGNFIDMGKSISNGAATNIRHAVQHGLNYFGICAGAFLAGKSDYYNSFDLANGSTFKFYAAADKGISKTAVAISSPNAETLDQYWENGPQLSGWGAVVAKYPEGTPAVAEGRFGKGFVILSGIHPEAPERWRGDLIFKTPASADNAYAAKLINAALKGTELPHY